MNEEIIIDGIDVSECENLCRFEDGDCCDRQYEKYASCEGYDCTYKQLRRLQAENEELKAEIKKHKANNLELLQYADEDKADIDRLERLYQDEHCDNLQLRKALEEIREIASAIINGKHITNDIEGHLKELSKSIIEKINEVLKDV